MHHINRDDLRRMREYFGEELSRIHGKLDRLFAFVEEIRRDYKKGPIVICSSQRFKEPVERLTEILIQRNFLVYPPNFKRHLKKMIVKPEHLRLQSRSYENRVPALAYDHFHNLHVAGNQAGVCFVYNEDGYIGRNTLSEMSIAHARGMPVFALMPHLSRVGRSKRIAKGEIYINRTLISHNGTFLKRPGKNGADLDALAVWLEERVK